MTVPNRSASSTAYRYGFQGEEKDDELKGEGNSINYKYRMHDPRVGRFFAVDPLTKKYPHYSPYSFSGNKVIHRVELEGLEDAKFNTTLYDSNLRNASDEEIKAFNKGQNDAILFLPRVFIFMVKQQNANFFKAPFWNNEPAKSYVDHHAFGKGEYYPMTKEEMVEVYPQAEHGVHLSPLDFFKAGNLKAGEEMTYGPKPIEAYSGTSGTLGNTTVTIEGIISINKNTNKKQFIGTVTFKDTYDFNPGDRPWDAELQCFIARNCLVGEPFEMGGTLEVEQQEGQALTLRNSFKEPESTVNKTPNKR